MSGSSLPAWCDCGEWKLDKDTLPKHLRDASNQFLRIYTRDMYVEHLEECLNSPKEQDIDE